MGNKAPIFVENPNGGRRRRSDLFNWISTQINSNERIIIGFDFSFAYPYCDFNEYFPCSINSLKNIRDLWIEIDEICALQNEFYAGPFYLTKNAPYAEYLLYQNYRGIKFNSRLRCTEKICAKSYTAPACTFKCVDPDSVGIGSVCGMRFLHRIKEEFGQDISIWPFDENFSARCIIVEIFPCYYYHRARQDPHLWRDNNCLNDTLKYYDTEPLPEELIIKNEDQRMRLYLRQHYVIL